MARETNVKRIEAEKLYTESNGKMKLIDISKQLEVPEGTVRGWKAKDKWSDKLNGTHQKEKRNETEKKRNVPKSRKRVTEDKKEEVIALTSIGKSKREAARTVGISPNTVCKIVNNNKDELEQYRTHKKMEFINNSWETINNALNYGNQKIILATVAAETFDEKIEELINALKDNEADYKTISDTIKALANAMNIPLRDIAVYVGTVYDKIALASGQSTQNINANITGPATTEKDISKMSTEELMAKLELMKNE